MSKILNNADLYFFEELRKVDVNYGDMFLLNFCILKNNNIQKSASFEDKCNEFFIDSFNMCNSPNTSTNSTSFNNSSDNSIRNYNLNKRLSQQENSYDNDIFSENKSRNSSPDSFDRCHSPISPNIENKIRNIYLNNKSSSGIHLVSLNSIDIEDSDNEDNYVLMDKIDTIMEKKQKKQKKKLKKNRENKSVSLNTLNDEIFKYKYLLYTDNSYIIPNHIAKLLHLIYGIDKNTLRCII